MMRKMFAILIMFCSTSALAKSSLQSLQNRAIRAAQVLETNHKLVSHAMPTQLLERATCIATFPNVIKGAFIIGARVGQGIVSCRVGGGWSNPTFMTLAGLSFGPQIGIDSTDLVLVFVNPNAIYQVTQSKLQLGFDISIAAGPLGRDAAIGTDFTLQSEIYAYSRARGLYAGISVNSSILDVEHESNASVYGVSGSINQLEANSSSPGVVRPYIKALERYVP